MTARKDFKIDGYPVSQQEILDQATMIRGNVVRSIGLAARILRHDGRDVTFPDASKAELRACVEGTLKEQGFLPRMRTQEARAGKAAPTTPEPGPRTDTAADGLDAMAAWNSADIAQHINKQTRKDVSND